MTSLLMRAVTTLVFATFTALTYLGLTAPRRRDEHV